MATHPLKGRTYTKTLGYNEKYPFTLPRALAYLSGKLHKGVDYACRIATPLGAVVDGKWVKVRNIPYPFGYGRYAVLETHDGQYRILYTHLQAIGIPRVGKDWNEGEVIAWSGNSGSSTNPHYHFAVQKLIANTWWEYIDPEAFLREYKGGEGVPLVERVNEALREAGARVTPTSSEYWQVRVANGDKKTYEALVGGIKWRKQNNRFPHKNED